MIIPVKGREYAAAFACVYNSANTLFEAGQRCDADETVFYGQLRDDFNFVCRIGDEICGFMSYHKSAAYYELTSLYVRREYQKKQVGSRLLAYFEEQVTESAWMIVKALNHAYWALDFYQKHGYETLNGEMRALVESWNVEEKAWEKILYKKRAGAS